MSQRDSHETYRVAAGRLHWVALGLAGTLVLIVAGMYLLAKPILESARLLPAPELPSAPRLQPHPHRDLARQRAREQGNLAGYAWVDRTNGIARIPIARAMELLAQRAAKSTSNAIDTTHDSASTPAAKEPSP